MKTTSDWMSGSLPAIDVRRYQPEVAFAQDDKLGQQLKAAKDRLENLDIEDLDAGGSPFPPKHHISCLLCSVYLLLKSIPLCRI